MPVAPRKALSDVSLPAHGGLDYVELEALGLRPEEIIDFSANLNPWGLPAQARAAALETALDRYPDAEASALRRALAEHLSCRRNLDENNLIAGNGSSELLWLIALAFLDAWDRVLIVGPTFGEYQRAALLAGAEVRHFDARPEDDFRLDLGALLKTLGVFRPKLLFLCNPNNPTGTYLDRDAVLSLCAEDRLLVLDEAYAGFVEQAWCSLDLPQHGVLVLRSMTKDYCLAGLRLGYAVALPEVIAALRKVRPPWNVNAVAQAAGIAALREAGQLAEVNSRLRASRDFLTANLRRLGLRVIPSATSFFLVETGDGAAFRRRLLSYGLLVRDCASFGLPGFIRIAARSLPDCERLIAAIEQTLVGIR